MSNKKLHILWLDDDASRISILKKQIAPALNDLGVSFETVEFDDAFLDIENAINKIGHSKPDLLVIDHFLDNRAHPNIPRTGSAWSLMFREKFPQIGLVGVSADEQNISFTKIQDIQYIERFALNELLDKSRLADLKAIAAGYRDLWATYKQGNIECAKISSWLKTPKSQRASLMSCLPGEFQSHWDNSTPHLFARWTWHKLLSWPGFTYDELETATAIGLNVSGLRLIEKILKPAEYAGVFASPARRRWWIAEVYQVILSEGEKDGAATAIAAGRLLAKKCKARSDRHFSKNYRTNSADPAPDCVAFEDESFSANRVTVDLAATQLMASRSPDLGFENLRIIKHT